MERQKKVQKKKKGKNEKCSEKENIERIRNVQKK